MDSGENPNPIVAMAMKIRARKELGAAIDSATPGVVSRNTTDVNASLDAFAEALALGAKRLNAILGKNGVTFVRLERPLRIRLRRGDARVSLDVDAATQLVTIRGLGFDGDYQFDTASDLPALINLSKLSTDAGYGDALTPATLLKEIAKDAELPRPPHLDSAGPLLL